MLRRLVLLLACLFALAGRPADAEQWISIPGRGGVALQTLLARPAGAGPFPAIVALHGCAGFANARGINPRDADWLARLTAAGFVVLMPDSFGSRGLGSQCNVRERDVKARDRAGDAFAAAEWLAKQNFVDQKRLGLLGWSNGGSTVLSAVRTGRGPRGVEFRQAIAFYPGCRAFDDGRYRARLPTTILHGLADDWTPAEPCRALPGTRFIGYEGAHHDFDHPSLPVRTRRAAYSANGSGIVTIGTHPEARAKAIADAMAIFRGM